MALPKRKGDDLATAVKNHIPTFRTSEEAAEFFDTHDMGDFPDDWEEVTDVRLEAAQPKNGIWLRLDDETLAELTKRARERRMSPATLARRWIHERLQDHTPD
jgi:hypothetical protein